MLTCAGLGLLGVSIMMIQNVYFFLFGRFIYGLSQGLNMTGGNRIVEECSPPRYLGLFMTIFSFGISLSRPTILLATFLLPDTKDP